MLVNFRQKFFFFYRRFFKVISFSLIEKIYLIIFFLLFIYSFFNSIPTSYGSIGVSSDMLQIGDRSFYINDSPLGYGYKDYHGNFLYPFVLSIIIKISNFFGQTSTSKFCNFIIITITSLLSIFSLRLLILSSKNLFNHGVSIYASLFYVVNPYSYFYPLTGGITNYVLFGVALITFIVSRSKNNLFNYKKKNFLLNLFYCLCICLYLSSLRPNGAIFSIIFIAIIIIKLLIDLIRINTFNLIITISIVLSMITFSYAVLSLFEVNKYILANITLFSEEGGLFFGYPRESLRRIISEIPKQGFFNFKAIIYTFMWKLTNFVSGISGIRDTYNFAENRDIFPFIARTFTGIFIIYPINLLSLLGVLFNLRTVMLTNIWLVLLSSIVSTLPSLIGVSMSRYWIMFYIPFLIFAGALIYNIKNNNKLLDV